MSKQHENITMKRLVPKLRFPEFLDAGDWKYKQLNKVYSFKVTNSFSRDKLNYENGSVKNIHYGDIHTKFSTLFSIDNEYVPYINPSICLKKIKSDSYCLEGDMIIADASEDLDDVGKSIEIVNLNNQKLISGLHTILARQIDSKLIIGFGGYLFKSDWIRFQIKKESQGAKVLGLSAGRFSKIKIGFPSDKKEQQKIADCLSSIDELITAHTQKHEALKAHKKGLMQQLFPAEGETVPKLRFPEFRDTGEWEEQNLNSLSVRIGDGIHSTPKYDDTGDYHFINGNNLIDGKISISESTKKVDANEAKKHSRDLGSRTILLSINGTIGNLALYENEQVMLGKSAAYINLKDNVVIGFIYNSLKTAKIKSFFFSELTGSTIKNLSLKTIREARISIPSPKEQQKIANCLSSVDDLVTTQAKKIESLKAHKKGLMQQLFPAIDGEINE